tara:strand:+ start:560 stop:889 length:330 start_codon:yes stop_codon:yes gene_type:complete
MKKLAVILIAFIAVIIAGANNGESEPKGKNSHSEIQYVLKNSVKDYVKHPDTLSFKEYDFVALSGNVGTASYTFTSKNSFGVNIINKAYVTVVLNDDLSVKEYIGFNIK